MHSFLISSLILSLFIHPFKISVSELNFNEKNNSIEVTIKIFQDDLEYTLDQINHSEITLEENRKDLDQIISTYLRQKFVVKVNNNIMTAKFVGYELEEDVIWIYIEYIQINKLQEVSINNQLLVEAFPGQSNLVHFKYHDEIKSRMCSKDNNIAVFDDFENW